MEQNKKKQVAKISVFITSIFVIFLSITYAFINMTVTGTKRQVITAGNLELELLEDDNNLTITNALPMYDEVGMIQDAFIFRLVNKTSVSTDYKIKLADITVGEGLDKSIVKYGLTKEEEQTIDFLSTIEESLIDSGTILGNQTIHYSLRLWIDSTVTDNRSIAGKSLSYRVDVEATQNTDSTPKLSYATSSSELISDHTILGDACTTYDDGVDTFLVGQCQNNYVWYSGKLWRVVLQNNETGAIKMITDNGITSISYYTSSKKDFKTSFANQWLKEEFLPTLHDYQDYLVIDSVWDTTMESKDIPTRPVGTTTVQGTVGLLNAYEYYTVYANSAEIATSETNYLNNESGYSLLWWTLTPHQYERVYRAGKDGVKSILPSLGISIRPVVNLKSGIIISEGTGTMNNPYRLEGDRQEIIPGSTLLNTRYSGEYVKFNNELYRIVQEENKLTKITSVKKPIEISSVPFDNTSTMVNFSQSSIKDVLENYYQGLDSQFKNMIQTNTAWYWNRLSAGENYKLTICSSATSGTSTLNCSKSTATTANIGMPRVGELFTSPIDRNHESFFTITISGNPSGEQTVYGDGSLNVVNPTYGYGTRASLYLKSTVKIASDNDGDGTYEHPYEIELGA